MTTTSQQQPEGDPSNSPGTHGPGRPGGGADGSKGARRTSLWLVLAAAVVVLVVAAAGWLFTAGPMSQSAQNEREIESTLEDMGSATSFAEFNDYLCAEQRVPQDLVDTISSSGEQTGTDLDAMFRESIGGSLPDDLQVTGVELEEGDATATVEAGAEDAEAEQVRMRDEDGAWKVCDPGVGMGSVPATE